MVKDYLHIAWGNIRNRQLRSWLTILGTVIGIALIVTMISLGEGMRVAVANQLNRFGPDVIYVLPGEEGDPFSGLIGDLHFTDDDVDVVASVKGVESAFPILVKGVTLTVRNEDKLQMVHGMPAEESEDFFRNFQGWDLEEGRWFREDSGEIVVGYRLATEGFVEDGKGKEIRVNQNIEVEGEPFTVVGIISTLGEREHDFTAYLDIDALRDLTDSPEEVQNIAVRVSPGSDPDEVAERIHKELEEERGTDDFAVFTNERMENLAGGIIAIIEIVLLGLAAVALVVGGIGIMNTMYTSVMERTRDIGIMKAVGAKNTDIMLIFLFEAGIIGAVGGIFGALIGIGVGKLVELIAHANGILLLEAHASVGLLLFAFFFSFGTGCIAGLLPAVQASRLKPVDALRYE